MRSMLLRAAVALGKFALGWAVFIAIWWSAIQIWDIQPLTLPPPGKVWDAAIQNWPSLRESAWITLSSIFWAFALAAVIGVLISLVLSRSRQIRAVVFPAIVALQAAPKVALAPLFVVWIGFGSRVAIFVGVLIAIFPMIMNTTTGLSTVDDDMVMMAKTMRASEGRVFLRIRLPYALPHIVSGLKTCMVLAIVGVVVGELTGAGSGLGYKISEQSAVFRTDYAFAAVVILVLMSLVLFYAIDIIERQFSWYERENQRSDSGMAGQAR
jgi:NitT/TauT family transport system permease protein